MWRNLSTLVALPVAVVAIYSALLGTDTESQSENDAEEETKDQKTSHQNEDNYDNYDDPTITLEDFENDDIEEQVTEEEDEDEEEDKSEQHRMSPRSPGWGFYADITPQHQMYSPAPIVLKPTSATSETSLEQDQKS